MRMIVAVILLMLAGGAAHARGITCSATMDGINLGSVAQGARTIYMYGQVTVSCSGTVYWWVKACFELGQGSGGSDAQHYTMKNATDNRIEFDVLDKQGNAWNNSYQPWQPYDFVIDESGSKTKTTTVKVPVYIAGNEAIGHYESVFVPKLHYNPSQDQSVNCASLPTVNLASWKVSADIVANCTVVASTLDFGRETVLRHAVDARATITANCTPTVSYSLTINRGENNDRGDRRMRSGSNYIPYVLYKDENRTQAWDYVSQTGNGFNQDVYVYGRVPAMADAPAAGTYRDKVVVTMSY